MPGSRREKDEIQSLFGEMSRDDAVNVAASIVDMRQSHGWQIMEQRMRQWADTLRKAQELRSADVSAILNHNRPLIKADAIEDILKWVEEVVAFADRAAEGAK